MTDQSSNSENQQRRLDPELLKKGLQCDLDQYDILKRCSDKNDMTEWNEWRKKNLGKNILLEGADLLGMNLNNVDLSDYGGIASTHNVSLKEASLPYAHLDGAKLHKAHLEGTVFDFAHLDNAFLLEVHLDRACLQCAELRNANVCNAHLDRANFIDAELQGSKFDNAFLIGTKFQKARVDGSTSFCYCKVDHETDFREVGIDSVQIDPATRQLLEYNIRRMNWEEWDKNHRLLKWPARLFWCFSDYGISTWRIIGWFFGLALFFAAIYANCACWWPPGIVSNLKVEPHLPLWHYFLLLLLRPVYFSVVTMTTGFSNMYANAQSIWGHILIGIQVLLGYVILGALVTRFAVLFAAGGPAGKFADEQSISVRLGQLWARIRGKNSKRP